MPNLLEIGLILPTKNGVYPGLFLFSTPGRMVRPVLNLAMNAKEWIGSFEQVRGQGRLLEIRYPRFCMNSICSHMLMNWSVSYHGTAACKLFCVDCKHAWFIN